MKKEGVRESGWEGRGTTEVSGGGGGGDDDEVVVV